MPYLALPTSAYRPHLTLRRWDDFRSRRARRAASLLWKLRACGEWELHLTHFFRRSSFAGCVFSPHIDVIALPHKVTQAHGLEVVQHMVAIFSKLLELGAAQARQSASSFHGLLVLAANFDVHCKDVLPEPTNLLSPPNNQSRQPLSYMPNQL